MMQLLLRVHILLHSRSRRGGFQERSRRRRFVLFTLNNLSCLLLLVDLYLLKKIKSEMCAVHIIAGLPRPACDVVAIVENQV